MNKEWVKDKENKAIESMNTLAREIKESLMNLSFLEEKTIKEIETALNNGICGNRDYSECESTLTWFSLVAVEQMLNYAKNNKTKTSPEQMNAWFKEVKFLEKEKFNKFSSYVRYVENIYDYLDGEPIEFDGDICITDPGYIIKDNEVQTDLPEPCAEEFLSYTNLMDYPDIDLFRKEIREYEKAKEKYRKETQGDWEKTSYGYNMAAIGINHFMTRTTLCGDWVCKVYDINTGNIIGEFCADAGLVSVFYVEEAKKYNPDFPFNKGDFTHTIIRDFKGTVQFFVREEKGVYENDSEYWSKGDSWVNYRVEVVGHGINKKTGERLDFTNINTFI